MQDAIYQAYYCLNFGNHHKCCPPNNLDQTVMLLACIREVPVQVSAGRETFVK
jgi:hypothetical protein